MTAYSTTIARIARDGSGETSAAGTGIVLDQKRVLTCAHVINAALNRSENEPTPPTGEAILSITIPLRPLGNTPFRMKVSLWRPISETPVFNEAEDLAVLELLGDTCFPDDVASARLLSTDLRDQTGERRVCMTGFRAGGSSDQVLGMVLGIDDRGRLQIDPAPKSIGQSRVDFAAPASGTNAPAATLVCCLRSGSAAELTLPMHCQCPLSQPPSAWQQCLPTRTNPGLAAAST